MDPLAHNAMIKIIRPEGDVLYRVILDDLKLQRTALVELIPRPTDPLIPSARGGRRRKANLSKIRKKTPLPTSTNPVWFDRDELATLQRRNLMFPVQIEPEAPYFLEPVSERSKQELARRREIATPFLNLDRVRESLLTSGGFTPLLRQATEQGCSRALAYKVLSLLCRFGFSERSLRDRRFGCGAPGEPRYCAPGGRKKSGRKTRKERLARAHGAPIAPEQPGMTLDWRNMIMTADDEISKLKIKMPERIDRILTSAFVKQFKFVDGVPVEIDLPKGSYPNRRQIQRVLNREIPKLVALQQKTTQGHFNRNMRGLRGRMWLDVSGPGHTWCMDSTVGDIYLRSTIDRSWVVGRPVVYIVVDVWSTAVIGFHVCLQHPSWNVAKIALFNSACSPDLLSEVYGFTVNLALDPLPTLPASLWVDNGEYRSRAGRAFGIYIPDESFTPPYRPDWHGVTEVLHRIGKEHIQSIPGGIDNRRKELELRQYRPRLSVMTLPEFARYLAVVFWKYNLTSDRLHRLDASMVKHGIQPSPAGLWRFGHSFGIGTQRAFPSSELIMDLLPVEQARVTKYGVFRAGLGYGWPEEFERDWSERARNEGGWNIKAAYHPAGIKKLWMPDARSGVLDLTLRDDALCPAYATNFDHLDVLVNKNLDMAELEHQRNLAKIKARTLLDSITNDAIEKTREADASLHGAIPSITASRAMELAAAHQPSFLSGPSAEPAEARYNQEAIDDHLAFSAQLSEEFNRRYAHD